MMFYFRYNYLTKKNILQAVKLIFISITVHLWVSKKKVYSIHYNKNLFIPHIYYLYIFVFNELFFQIQ